MVSSTHDQLYKFIFDDLEVRGEIVQLHDVYSNIFANKSYPKAIKKILAQLVVISNLITASTKIEGETTTDNSKIQEKNPQYWKQKFCINKI